MAATLDRVIADIRAIQRDAREARLPHASALADDRASLRPKGWTGPKRVDGKQIEGTFRAHQVPLGEMADKPEHVAHARSSWMKSYRPR